MSSQTTDLICSQCGGLFSAHDGKTHQPTQNESISITVRYANEGEGSYPEHLTHTVEWNHVPSQSKVWDRAKEMVDILYKQVR